MLAIEADAMGASGDGDPNAASVLLGVFRLSPLLLLFREADGVSACCCFFSGEIDLARSVGQPQGQIPHLGHMQLIIFPQYITHLLCVQVVLVCPSQSPLPVSDIVRCPLVLSSLIIRGQISGTLQGPNRLPL